MRPGFIAFLLVIAFCRSQATLPGVDPAVAAKIKQEVAEPITKALPGWVVGDDLGPGALEAWDSKDARRLRATLVFVPMAKSAGTTVDRVIAAQKRIPDLKILDDDPLCRRVSTDDFAEALTLVQVANGNYRFHVIRAVALGDAFMPPYLLATFTSRKGESLDDFKASIGLRIRGLDPAFDTLLMLALQRRVQWHGDANVTIAHAGNLWTFVAPEGFTRVADNASIAVWKTDKAVARVHALLGSEQDAVAFARRWILEPCVAGVVNTTPLVLKGMSAPDKGEYSFIQLPQLNEAAPQLTTKGWFHEVQVRGGPTLFFVYDAATDIGDGKDLDAVAEHPAIKAAFAATTEAPVKARVPEKKKQ
jgi:hypothetical protein